MTNKTSDEPFSFYKEHPKTCAPDDFWGQVKRTVNGQPVSEAQIEMIVAAVLQGLDIKNDDVLMDLCCGNGALSRFFFEKCQGGLGVDFSQALIDVAKQNFEKLPHQEYRLADVVEFTKSPPRPERFTKILCYGSFAYLEKDAALAVLRNSYDTFRNADTFYIGNCPDKSQLSDFFREKDYTPGIENEADSAIGIWRTKEEFRAMARAAGWSAEFSNMPELFYASKYRYDVILRRAR